MLPLPAGTRILTQAEAQERARQQLPATRYLGVLLRKGQMNDRYLEFKHRTTCEVCGEYKDDDGKHRCPSCLERWGIDTNA
jgi:rubrerythrin